MEGKNKKFNWTRLCRDGGRCPQPEGDCPLVGLIGVLDAAMDRNDIVRAITKNSDSPNTFSGSNGANTISGLKVADVLDELGGEQALIGVCNGPDCEREHVAIEFQEIE